MPLVLVGAPKRSHHTEDSPLPYFRHKYLNTAQFDEFGSGRHMPLEGFEYQAQKQSR